MQIEAEHVDDHRNDDQANNSDNQVCSKFNHRHLLVAKFVPQIVCGVETDQSCNKQTNPFDRADAANADTCQEQPDEPFHRPALVSQRVESCPAKRSGKREAEEHGIEEDESRNGSVRVLAENSKGAEPDSWTAEAKVSSSPVCEGNDDSSEQGVEHSHEGVVDLRRVGVAGLEFEGTVVTSEVS